MTAGIAGARGDGRGRRPAPRQGPPLENDLIAALDAITARRAPFRHMVTPGGFVMSVAMTNCGAAG